MSSSTDNFFEVAQNHSKVKLIVLNKFINIWKNKVFYDHYNKENNKLIIIDGFAGPGSYKNGEKGSPLICLDSSFGAINQRNSTNDINNKKMKINLFFCENNKESYESLCEKINNRGLILKEETPSYKKYKTSKEELEVSVSNKNFLDFFEAFTEARKQKYINDPCFTFVDPFGYKDVALESIINFFKAGKKTDLILNMIYEHFNRFLTTDSEELNKTHKKFLGASDKEFRTLQKQICNRDSHKRMELITNFYMNRIKENGLYITKMEIKKGNKIKMILFYITKNLTGFNLFKDIKYEIETALEEMDQQKKLFQTKEDLLKNELKIFLKKNYYPCFKFDEVLIDIKNHNVFFERIYRQVIQEMKKNYEIEVYLNGKKDNRAIEHTEIKFVERNKNEQNKNRMDTSNLESNNRLF